MTEYPGHHHEYCGVDLHARALYVCLVNQADEILEHREMPTKADVFLEKLAPYREDVGGSGECSFTWYWLAALCAAEKIPFVLGHALEMKALHGAKTKNDRSDSKKIAPLVRAGMVPMASVSPKALRSTRALFRRRRHVVHQRSNLLLHIHPPNSQDTLPTIGKR